MRRQTAIQWEGNKGILSMAGVSELAQNNISVNATSENTYAVTNKQTRRVIAMFLSSSAGDIRFKFNSTATASHLPLVPARYFTIDARIVDGVADVLHFYNVTNAPITVYLMEIM